jgi:hypothetical protein
MANWQGRVATVAVQLIPGDGWLYRLPEKDSVGPWPLPWVSPPFLVQPTAGHTGIAMLGLVHWKPPITIHGSLCPFLLIYVNSLSKISVYLNMVSLSFEGFSLQFPHQGIYSTCFPHFSPRCNVVKDSWLLAIAYEDSALWLLRIFWSTLSRQTLVSQAVQQVEELGSQEASPGLLYSRVSHMATEERMGMQLSSHSALGGSWGDPGAWIQNTRIKGTEVGTHGRSFP